MDRTEAIEVLTKMLDCEDIDFCDSDCFKCRLFTRDVDRSNALIMSIKTLGKDINVPSKSALDHIHNVVRDDAYRRGYEQGKKDAAPTWIPTSERVPSNNDTVLIVHKGGVSTGWWNGRYWERGASSNHRMLKTVTHWMPFPEAPKGE